MYSIPRINHVQYKEKYRKILRPRRDHIDGLVIIIIIKRAPNPNSISPQVVITVLNSIFRMSEDEAYLTRQPQTFARLVPSVYSMAWKAISRRTKLTTEPAFGERLACAMKTRQLTERQVGCNALSEIGMSDSTVNRHQRRIAMKRLPIRFILFPVGLPLFLGASCAWQSDLDSLRTEVNSLRTLMEKSSAVSTEEARKAMARAEAAARTSDQAAQAARRAAELSRQAASEAKMASDKAGQMFRRSLRK